MMAFQVNINTKKNVNVKSIFLFMKTTRDGWVGMRYMYLPLQKETKLMRQCARMITHNKMRFSILTC